MSTTAVKFLAAAVLLLARAGSALAEVHYVDVNGTNAAPPYANWTTAATNIQDAVDAAVAGDEIVVTNGIYAIGGRDGNRVKVDKPLGVRSVNGPQFTIINGGGPCVYLTNNASLSGFTLRNGFVHSDGGGVRCEGTSAVVSNCVITGNRASSINTSLSVYGGGAYGGTLNNCTLTGNSASDTINVANGSSHTFGGGAAYCTLHNCALSGNSAGDTNTAMSLSGAATEALGGGAAYCTLHNCTLYGNTASVRGGQFLVAVGGTWICTVNNCIISGNTPGNGGGLGSNNWTGEPPFVSPNDLRLRSNSPCINAGNNALAPVGPDLDGNPRIAGGTVDIGAYEFQSPASMISYAWLQQFNLPINPATDTADPDGDGVDNYHEWLAGTDPTSPLSSPAQLTIFPSETNVILTWPTNAVGFALQSATNLSSPDWSTNSPAPVVIGGQNVVTNPIAGPRQFYRLRQ